MSKNLVCILFLLIALSLRAADRQSDAAKPPKPEKGHGRYLVVLWEGGTPIPGKPGEHMKKVPEPDIAKMGGRLWAVKERERLIDLPVARANELRRHEAVAILQRLWEGEPLADLTEEQPSSRSRFDVKSDADTDLTWGPKDYEYDSSGNIKRIGNDNYTYDTAGRLIQATVAGKVESFKYDAFGNLVEKAVAGANPEVVPVDGSTNRIVGMTYDAAGNMTSRSGYKAYSYDSLNMMSRTTIAGHAVRRMLYDANDERIAMMGAGTARWWVRDFGGRVLREYRGSEHSTNVIWVWEHDYVYGDGGLVGGERVQWSYNGITYGGKRHYHLDHLGSVRVVTDASGRSVSEHDYFAFGVTPTKAYQEPIDVGDPHIDSMRFAGHQREFLGATNTENTDYLDYMHARYYDPNLGRFLSVDPVLGEPSQPQSWNRYAYALNNPLRYVDPTGMDETAYHCDERGDNCYYETTRTALEYTASDTASDFFRGAFTDALMATGFPQTVAGAINGDAGQFATGLGKQALMAVPGGAASGATRTFGSSGLIAGGLNELAVVGRALPEVPHVALGVREGLRTFAREVGAEHLLADAAWQQTFLGHVQNGARFSIRLDGMAGGTPREMILNQVRFGGNTAWELRQLMQAGSLGRSHLYLNGARVPNPF